MFIYFFLLFFNYSFANKIAIIDEGISNNNEEHRKLFYVENKKCLYNFSIEKNELNCSLEAYPTHADPILNFLAKKINKPVFLSYKFAEPETIKMIADLKYPTSLKEVYIKKKLYKQISVQIAESINFAVRNNANIINISLSNRWLHSFELEESIKNNHQVVFIVAAGNSGNNLDKENNYEYPCYYAKKYNNVKCIGSLDNKGNIASYSNYGSYLSYHKPVYDEGTSYSVPFATLLHYQKIAINKKKQDK